MSETAYTPADGTSLAHWTFKSPPNRANWQPDLSIGNTVDATSAPAYPAASQNDPRSEPGIVTAVRAKLGTVPANTAQGFLAWEDWLEEETLFSPSTTGTSDPAGGDDSLTSDAIRWVELTYDVSTDLICPLGSSFAMWAGGLLLRSATVAAHWTFEGGGTGWLRNQTP